MSEFGLLNFTIDDDIKSFLKFFFIEKGKNFSKRGIMTKQNDQYINK